MKTSFDNKIGLLLVCNIYHKYNCCIEHSILTAYFSCYSPRKNIKLHAYYFISSILERI